MKKIKLATFDNLEDFVGSMVAFYATIKASGVDPKDMTFSPLSMILYHTGDEGDQNTFGLSIQPATRTSDAQNAPSTKTSH